MKKLITMVAAFAIAAMVFVGCDNPTGDGQNSELIGTWTWENGEEFDGVTEPEEVTTESRSFNYSKGHYTFNADGSYEYVYYWHSAFDWGAGESWFYWEGGYTTTLKGTYTYSDGEMKITITELKAEEKKTARNENPKTYNWTGTLDYTDYPRIIDGKLLFFSYKRISEQNDGIAGKWKANFWNGTTVNDGDETTFVVYTTTTEYEFTKETDEKGKYSMNRTASSDKVEDVTQEGIWEVVTEDGEKRLYTRYGDYDEATGTYISWTYFNGGYKIDGEYLCLGAADDYKKQ